MHGKQQFQNSLFHTMSRTARGVLALVIVFVLMVVCSQAALAQTFKVMYSFTGGQDGAEPWAGLTMDSAGNFYGTAAEGAGGNGTVFRLANSGSGWILFPLHRFVGGDDGAKPYTRVVIGPDGSLYGTTSWGGVRGCGVAGYGCGTVFKLTPGAAACVASPCDWTETVLYRFKGGKDGRAHRRLRFCSTRPATSTAPPVTGARRDAAITAAVWCTSWCPPAALGRRGFFTPSRYDGAGAYPSGGLIFDGSGRLYGTTSTYGSGNAGGVFQLERSGSDWNLHLLYAFHSLGNSRAGLIFDKSSNLRRHHCLRRRRCRLRFQTGAVGRSLELHLTSQLYRRQRWGKSLQHLGVRRKRQSLWHNHVRGGLWIWHGFQASSWNGRLDQDLNPRIYRRQ